MPSYSIVLIKTDESVTDINSQLTGADNQTFLQNFSNYVKAIKSSITPADIMVGSTSIASADPVQASLAGTFAGVPAENDTLTIAGVTITFVNGTATGNQIKRDDAPSVSTLATRLKAVCDANATISGILSASVNLGVCTLTCKIPGIIGNQIRVAESATDFSWAGAATALASGTGVIPTLTSYEYNR